MFPLPPIWRLVVTVLLEHFLLVAAIFAGVVWLLVDALVEAARSWGAP